MTEDPFRTLGLPRRFDLSRQEISAAHLRVVGALHPDRASDPVDRDRLVRASSEAGAAKQRLLSDVGRAEELLRVLGLPLPSAGDRLDPAFLAESLELREEIEATLSGAVPAEIAALHARVRAMRDEALAELSRSFDGPLDPSRAGSALVRMRYLERMCAAFLPSGG